jgi:hypothetical protein
MKKTPAGASRGSRGPERSPQRQAAEAAGLSLHQMRQALDVARIPDDEFEALIEADEPPTLTELARIGGDRPLSPTRRRRCPHCGGEMS